LQIKVGARFDRAALCPVVGDALLRVETPGIGNATKLPIITQSGEVSLSSQGKHLMKGLP